jgi:hypothetical protein
MPAIKNQQHSNAIAVKQSINLEFTLSVEKLTCSAPNFDAVSAPISAPSVGAEVSALATFCSCVVEKILSKPC